MSRLEQRYRQLFRAYPGEHRRRREDEMVGALLDAAAPGQRWPTGREAASILANGWRVRAASSTEWRLGFEYASVAAIVVGGAIAGALLGIAVLPPVHRAPARHLYGPVVGWSLALLAIVASCVAARRRIPLVLGSLALAAALVGGADLVGSRRSVAVSGALLALLAAAGATDQSRRRSVRAGALAAGGALALALLYRIVDRFGRHGQWLAGGSWPWMDRWVYAPYATRLPEAWWWGLVALSLAAGLVRPRFAVAGAILCAPLLALTPLTISPDWVAEHGLRLGVVLVALVGLALVRGWLAYRPARSSGEALEP